MVLFSSLALIIYLIHIKQHKPRSFDTKLSYNIYFQKYTTTSFLSGPNVIVKFSKMFEDCGKKATNEDVILAVNSHYDWVSREGWNTHSFSSKFYFISSKIWNWMSMLHSQQQHLDPSLKHKIILELKQIINYN